MLFAVAVTLPVIESQAGYGKHASASWRKRNKRMTRRQYRAYLRRRRAARARRIALARLRAQEQAKVAGANVPAPRMIAASTGTNFAPSAGMPHISLPAGWSGGSKGGEMRWQVAITGRADTATVTFAPLGFVASDDASSNPRSRTFGGYPHSDLRRQVIDRMIAESGWVTNDTVRVIGGRRTFVVSAANGRPEAPNRWTYYFTAVDNRLYRFVSVAPEDHADKIAGEIEALVASIRPSAPSPLTARGSE